MAKSSAIKGGPAGGTKQPGNKGGLKSIGSTKAPRVSGTKPPRMGGTGKGARSC